MKNKLAGNSILAFDGLDNTGKSTQIRRVRKYFSDIPFVVLNIEAPVGESNEAKIEYGIKNTQNNLAAMQLLSENNIPQILDRTHFSEYAYSFFRGGHDLDQFLEIEKDFEVLKERVFIITFVDRAENIAERDDGLSAFDPKKLQDIEKIVQNFKDISEKSTFKNAVIHIKGKDEETVFKEVIEKIQNFTSYQ